MKVLVLGIVAHRLRVVLASAAVFVSAVALTGCGGGGGYTVGEIASTMKANVPTSPFTNNAYDTCVATYLLNHETTAQIKALMSSPSFPAVAGAGLTAAEDNCVVAGSGI